MRAKVKAGSLQRYISDRTNELPEHPRDNNREKKSATWSVIDMIERTTGDGFSKRK